jgi:hypothetical protein
VPLTLLERIVRCDEIAKAGPGSGHDCEEIVSVQHCLGGGESYQVPEPWRGDIRRAPLLFVSSNPSIELLDDAPWSHQKIEEITNYYSRHSISDRFPKARLRYGDEASGPVPFWRSVNEIAKELYGTDVVAGRDFAITEVVHCKSRKEYGVKYAKKTCADKFLADVLDYSGAVVVVTLGPFAEEALTARQRKTHHVALAHPNARGNMDMNNTNQVETRTRKAKRKKPKTIKEACESLTLSTEKWSVMTQALINARCSNLRS